MLKKMFKVDTKVKLKDKFILYKNAEATCVKFMAHFPRALARSGCFNGSCWRVPEATGGAGGGLASVSLTLLLLAGALVWEKQPGYL